MPAYYRVRNRISGAEYDKTVDQPLRDCEERLTRPRDSDRYQPPKHRTDKGGRPSAPRSAERSTPQPSRGTSRVEPMAAVPAETEKE